MPAINEAVAFLLGHVIRHGDGVAVPQAERYLEALKAEAELKPVEAQSQSVKPETK